MLNLGIIHFERSTMSTKTKTPSKKVDKFFNFEETCAFYFRIPLCGRAKPEYYGIAIGTCPRSLFWQIDEFCDPYRVQLRQINYSAGICFKVERAVVEDGCDTFVNIEYDVLTMRVQDPEAEWFKPVWPKHVW